MGFGLSFSWLEVDLSFFEWELVLSFLCVGWPFLLGGCSSSGVMVNPSLLGLVFLAVGGVRHSSLRWGVVPSFSGLSFFGWELVLSFWCGSWLLPSWGVNFCLFLLVDGVWAFLLGVRAGPPFSGFGLALACVSHGGCGLFLLSVGVRPPFWEWWLALPSWGRVWPAGIGPSLLWRRFAMPSLRRGLALLGLGPRSDCRSGLLGMGWPSPLGVGVGVGLSFFGWELVLSFWCGFGPSFELALPSRDGELTLLSWGCCSFFLQWWMVLPSCCLPFLLAVSGPHSFLGWGLALRDESWPFLLGVGQSPE